MKEESEKERTEDWKIVKNNDGFRAEKSKSEWQIGEKVNRLFY